MISESSLYDAAARNLSIHASWVQARSRGMRVRADDRLTMSDSGLATDTFNIVCSARLKATEVQHRLSEVIGYFSQVRRPFSWWVGPGDDPADLGEKLLASGLIESETELAMAADLSLLGTSPFSRGDLRIERANSVQKIFDFALVVAANWNPPDLNVIGFYRTAASVLVSGDCPLWLYVGYLGRQAVASAEVTVAEGTAGLYSVSTLAAHRRKGIATSIIARALLDARDAHSRVGVLQASAGGAALYRRVGFREMGRYTEYKPR